MAHKKATGSKATQGGNVAGKRLGIKTFGGQAVSAGSIIMRQKGNVVHPGLNVGQGRDFTLFALIPGTIKFAKKLGKKVVSVEKEPTGS